MTLNEFKDCLNKPICYDGRLIFITRWESPSLKAHYYTATEYDRWLKTVYIPEASVADKTYRTHQERFHTKKPIAKSIIINNRKLRLMSYV